MADRGRAPRNRTLSIATDERAQLRDRLVRVSAISAGYRLLDKTIHGDVAECVPKLARCSVDLLILDPPYNLNKQFRSARFAKRDLSVYENWFRAWLQLVLPALKPTASVYVCSDWSTSPAVYAVISEHLVVRNRITWEREKGRGALSNWKNCSEDIWFCTVGDSYVFNVDAVKLKRRVVAPYKEHGRPKDWEQLSDGQYRFTSPSNLWTDITVPFWSMPENTEHPTQKPEKLIAKLILASSNPGQLVLDPFVGSGTSSVVAKKLGRRYIGIDAEEEYCLLCEKRLALAEADPTIQGYSGNVFLERNTLVLQMQQSSRTVHPQGGLF